MKVYIYIAIIIVFSFLTGCEDEIEVPGIKMKFGETQCSNPWDALPQSDNYLLTVHQFLNDNGIEIYSITIELIDGGNGIYCSACSCPSGRKIVIRIPVADIEAAEQVGFTIVQ